MDVPSDEDVSAAFGKGGSDALRLVYQRFGALGDSLARRSLSTVADAEGITQQVFVSAWRGRDTFDPERGSLFAFPVTGGSVNLKHLTRSTPRSAPACSPRAWSSARQARN